MNIKDGSNKPYMSFDVDAHISRLAQIMVNKDMTVEELVNERSEHPSLSNSYVDGKELYMWGWIGNEVPNKKWPSQKLKEKVIGNLEKVSSECRIEFCCGWHDCEVCDKDTGFNGAIYIRHKKKVYCCPNGVEHYIKDHDYCPPNVVVEAVLNGSPMSGYDCITKFIEKNKRKINKQYRIQRHEKAIEEENRKIRDIRMKRLENARTPEQKSVLSRLKKGTLDII